MTLTHHTPILKRRAFFATFVVVGVLLLCHSTTTTTTTPKGGVFAQSLPFDLANLSIPFPTSLECPASSSSSSLSLPSMTWCGLDNPYILSDFLSRNSTDLTTRHTTTVGAGSSVAPQVHDHNDFELHIQCGGVLLKDTRAFVDYTTAFSAKTSVGSSCKAIKAINAGAAGVMSADGTINNLTNYIVFADLMGQLLFVYFNNNSMATNLKIGVPNINNFATINVQYSLRVNRSNSASVDDMIVQNMILFVTNRTQASLVMVNGLDGSLSQPCRVFQYTPKQAAEVDLMFVSAEFYPRSANISTDVINIGWVASMNYSLMLKNWRKVPSVSSYAAQLYYYEFTGAPIAQRFAATYVGGCNINSGGGGTPSATAEVLLQVNVTSLRSLKFQTTHNSVRNMSFLVIHSSQGIMLHRLQYNSTSRDVVGGDKIRYTESVPLAADWCRSTAVRDPLTGALRVAPRAKSTIFCVPNTDTVIDSVEVVSPDSFVVNGADFNELDENDSSVLWIVAALRNQTHTYLYAMSLGELSVVPNANSTFDNPLGLPDTFSTVAFPCHFDTEVMYFSRSENTFLCRSRLTTQLVLSQHFGTVAPIVTDLTSRIVAQSALSSSAAKNANITTLIASMLGMSLAEAVNVAREEVATFLQHVLLFASQGNTVSVLSLFRNSTNYSASISPASNNSFDVPQLELLEYNEIAFLGDVSSVYVSENGMHMFTSIERQAWQLEAQSRYVDICAKLVLDPSDVFLQAYAAQCQSSPPQAVNINAFTQYASYCTAGIYCPSLNQLEASIPPHRHYADRPAVVKLCPVGYFCKAGQKIECPQGFYCDEEGLSAPKRCSLPLNSDSTCDHSGLSSPATCPPGTVCLLPHLPSVPAPPGFMTPAAPTLRTDLTECAPGEWCSLGAQAPINDSSTYTASTFMCPGNTFCGEPWVLEPDICVCGDDGTITTANGKDLITCKGLMLYCPVGSYDVQLCPAGFYCTAPNVSVACIPSQYCAPGTFATKLCPKGYYCPTPNVSIVCPSGYYCPDGTVVPIACNFLTTCHQGSSSQTRSLLTVVVLSSIGGVPLRCSVFVRFEQRSQQRAAAVSLLSREAQEFITQGGLEEEEYLADVVVGYSASSRIATGAGSFVLQRQPSSMLSQLRRMSTSCTNQHHRGDTLVEDVSQDTHELLNDAYLLIDGNNRNKSVNTILREVTNDFTMPSAAQSQAASSPPAALVP
ncbi:membrane-associated protein, putative, partial [Bodo saltans]